MLLQQAVTAYPAEPCLSSERDECPSSMCCISQGLVLRWCAMKNAGSKMREAREMKGLSQRKLAGLIGKHYNTICNWETGHTRISLEDALLVREALAPYFTLEEAVDEQTEKGSAPHE